MLLGFYCKVAGISISYFGVHWKVRLMHTEFQLFLESPMETVAYAYGYFFHYLESIEIWKDI